MQPALMYKGRDIWNHTYEYYRLCASKDWPFAYQIENYYTKEYEESEHFSHYIRYPHLLETGNSPAFKLGDNPASLTLALYRGNNATSHGCETDYPYLSSDNLGYNNEVVWQKSLFLHGKYGIFETFWKEWFNFLSEAEIHYSDKKLSFAELYNINFRKKIKIENQLYLIDEIDVEISFQNGIEKCTQKLYRI